MQIKFIVNELEYNFTKSILEFQKPELKKLVLFEAI